jgi:hypothetical protein
MAKEVTREQAQRKKAQAAAFLDRIGQSDRAQDFADMSVDEYAHHKGLRLTNPRNRRERNRMANGNGTTTKADLQDTIDQAISILDDAYTPEVSREDLAEAVGSALETLRGEDEDDDDADNGDDDLDDSGD